MRAGKDNEMTKLSTPREDEMEEAGVREYKPEDPWYINKRSPSPWKASLKCGLYWTSNRALERAMDILEGKYLVDDSRDPIAVVHWYIEFYNELARKGR